MSERNSHMTAAWTNPTPIKDGMRPCGLCSGLGCRMCGGTGVYGATTPPEDRSSAVEGDAAKPQQGTWTLTAPDGRAWQADSPLRCVGVEQRERVPAEVAMRRIQEAAAERSLFERAAEALAAYMGAMRADWADDRASIMHRIREADKLAKPVYAELYAIVNPDAPVTLGGGLPGDPNGTKAGSQS